MKKDNRPRRLQSMNLGVVFYSNQEAGFTIGVQSYFIYWSKLRQRERKIAGAWCGVDYVHKSVMLAA